MILILLVPALVFGLLLRREAAAYPRMIATLYALDISLCALSGVTTWHVVFIFV